jgi:outer membrane protein assembly factor BamD (BamD/ComL family)
MIALAHCRVLGNLVMLGVVLWLSGCGTWSSENVSPGAVAGLGPGTLEPSLVGTPVPTDTTAAQRSYERALLVIEDETDRQAVELRLANLQRDQAEKQLEEGLLAGGLLDRAVVQYVSLLSEANSRVRPQVLYQLARTYSLAGRSEEATATLTMLVADFPGSEHVTEARFRIAEADYLQGDYTAALNNYSQVIGEATSVYQRNALYMRGWCLFKLSRYDAALLDFVTLLDDLPTFASMDELSPVDARMAADTTRVMSISLSYLQGGQSVTSLLAQVGARPYGALLYQTLAEFYRDKDRLDDSVASLQAYLDANPMDRLSPFVHGQIIDIYQLAGFDERLLAEKLRYVQRYGVRSTFWQHYRDDSSVFDVSVLATLKALLGELADRAQVLATDVSGQRAALAGYQEYVDTIGDAPEANRYWFLLGEAATSLGIRDTADHSYHVLAYERAASGLGADAGYNYWLLASSDGAGERARRAALYADSYGLDERLTAVLADTAGALLDQDEPVMAFDMATQLLTAGRPIEPAMQRAMVKILGHSSFAMGDYSESEVQFMRLLAMDAALPSLNAEDIRASIAASIHRQSEAARSAGENELAVKHLLRIAQVSPGSTLAVSGQIDGAALLVDMQQWRKAEQLLSSLITQLPDHPRADQLVAMYLECQENQQDWSGAAKTLMELARTTVDADLAAAQMWQSIVYYRQAGQLDLAIGGYHEYVRRFPQPVAQVLEALDQLSDLLTQTGALEQRDQILQQILTLNARQADKGSQRTRYLAAKAAATLAEELYQVYQAIPLKLPLANSLKQKQAALTLAVAAYQQVQGLGVLVFQGQANYRLGDIYQNLAVGLLTSRRPEDLDESVMATYNMLLEEQAYPFEELAITFHETNVQFGWQEGYNEWVDRSLVALAELSPARYAKFEWVVEYANEIL